MLSFLSYGQNNVERKVKFKIVLDENRPLIAANLIVLDSNPINGTNTDLSGNAELTIDNNSDYSVQIIFISPYSPILDVPKKADSVFVDYKRKKATYYYKNEKIKKSKLRF